MGEVSVGFEDSGIVCTWVWLLLHSMCRSLC